MSGQETEDRRQRAREAYYDSTRRCGAQEGSAVALNEAIETATQVKLTPEIVASAEAGVWGGGGRDRARAVLEAAGFEVIE